MKALIVLPFLLISCLPVGEANPCYFEGDYDVTNSVISGDCFNSRETEYIIDQPIEYAVQNKYRMTFATGKECDLVQVFDDISCHANVTCDNIFFNWQFTNDGFSGNAMSIGKPKECNSIDMIENGERE